jgi:hypothetical protein
MTLQARMTTLGEEILVAPITLKVCYEWERWTGKTIADMATPSTYDFAVLCWRAAINARLISKRTSLDDFAGELIGWEILNITPNGIGQLEDWLREQ